ncbi:MAG: histidine kinase [Ekhidna sp.]
MRLYLFFTFLISMLFPDMGFSAQKNQEYKKLSDSLVQISSNLERSINELEKTYLQKEADQALKSIDSLLKISVEYEIYTLETRLLKMRREVPEWQYENDNMLRDLDRRIEISKQYDTENLAILYQSKATFELRRGNADMAMLMLDSVDQYLHTVEQPEKSRIKAQSYYLKGRQLDRVGNLEQAVMMYQLCISEAEKVNYDLKIMAVYFELGYVHKLLGNIQQSIKSFEKSLKYSLSLQDTSYTVFNRVFIAGVYNGMAVEDENEERKNHLATAAMQLTIAEELAISRNDAYELELLFYELAQYHMASENYSAAIKYIELCRSETTKTNNFDTEIPTYSLASNSYYKMEQYGKALEQAKIGIDLTKEKASLIHLVGLYESASAAAEKLGNMELALNYSNSYISVNDSIRNEAVAKSINDIQTKYETEKKEAEIDSLKQASEIQSLLLKQRNLIIIFSLLAFVFIVVVILIVNRQRNAAKRKKQIEVEQRFLRSQLNPHFISNALVAVQSSLMENNVDNASTYLDTFSRLMRDILENSREELISIEDEVDMLSGYLEINQKRLKDQIEYTVAIDENIDTDFDRVPPMLIQPFVENAIDHGIPPKGEKMKIDVQFSKEHEAITVVIKDNGGGIQENSNSRKRSLSTQIIKERIDLLNQSLKEKITLNMENWTDEWGSTRGLKVTLSLHLH